MCGPNFLINSNKISPESTVATYKISWIMTWVYRWLTDFQNWLFSSLYFPETETSSGQSVKIYWLCQCTWDAHVANHRTLMIDVLESRTSQLDTLAASLPHRDQDMPVTVHSQETSTFGIFRQTKINCRCSAPLRTYSSWLWVAMTIRSNIEKKIRLTRPGPGFLWELFQLFSIYIRKSEKVVQR